MRLATKAATTVALIVSGLAALLYGLCKLTAISVLSTANAVLTTWND